VNVGGHPLHTMLVGIPITLYLVTFGCFVASALGAEAMWFRIGVYANLAGVIAVVLVSIPGFIDWAFGVPTGSPAKATGMWHMAFNLVALIPFAVNVFLQWGDRHSADPATTAAVVLTGVGVALTGVAGFLGGELVLKHHVGVQLTAEQQRLEPRANPRVERRDPTH